MANALKKVEPSFRSTAAGVKLGRQIFDPSVQFKLTPGQIVSLLQAAGLKIPNEVRVTTDIAQIIMAGGAFVSDVEKAGQIGQLAQIADIASVYGAILDILEVSGIINPKSGEGFCLKFAADALLVAASNGSNIGADIALAMDYATIAIPMTQEVLLGFSDLTERTKEYSDSRASKELAGNLRVRMDWEKKAAANLLKGYHNGSIKIFDFIEYMARYAPDYFTTFFPEFNGFVPQVDGVLSVTKTESNADANIWGGLFGNVTYSTSTKTAKFKTIRQYSHEEIQRILFEKFVIAPTEVYRFIPDQGDKCNIVDLACLSLLPPFFSYMDDNFDITETLLKNNLSPKDLGYSVVELAFNSGLFGRVGMRVDSPVTFNGVEYFTTTQKTYNANIDLKNYTLQKIKEFEENDDIVSLAKIPSVRRVLKAWGTLTPPHPSLPLAKDQMGRPLYRNIQNYWSAIGMMTSVLSDPYFNSTSSFKMTSNDLYKRVSMYLPDEVDLEERHKEIQFLSVGRSLNITARKNIAAFYNTTPDKIQIIPGEKGQLIKVLPLQKPMPININTLVSLDVPKTSTPLKRTPFYSNLAGTGLDISAESKELKIVDKLDNINSDSSYVAWTK